MSTWDASKESLLDFQTKEYAQMKAQHDANVDALLQDRINMLEQEGKPYDIEDLTFSFNRLKGIGGSDIAAIMGLSPYKTPYQLWCEKTLRETDHVGTENVYMHWGKLLENVIREEYISNIGKHYGTYLPSPQFSYSIAAPADSTPMAGFTVPIIVNLDGLICDPSGEPLRVHEIKTAAVNSYTGDFTEEGAGILSWGKGNQYFESESTHELTVLEEDGQIPIAYMLQVQTYMMAVGVDVADVSVLIGHHDFRNFTVYANKELQERIQSAVLLFWIKVMCDSAPELTAKDLGERQHNNDFATASNSDVQYCDLLRSINKRINDAKKQKAEIEDLLKVSIGETQGLTDASGRVLATWKMTSGRKKFNEQKFREDHPDMWEEYTEQVAGSRRFLLKELKGDKA